MQVWKAAEGGDDPALNSSLSKWITHTGNRGGQQGTNSPQRQLTLFCCSLVLLCLRLILSCFVLSLDPFFRFISMHVALLYFDSSLSLSPPSCLSLCLGHMERFPSSVLVRCVGVSLNRCCSLQDFPAVSNPISSPELN